MTTGDAGARIAHALARADLSQRALAETTRISQPTLSRIMAGQRRATIPELVAIAWETGHTLAQLTGDGAVSDRIECAARGTNGSDMPSMRQALLSFLELDDYLDNQAIPATL